MRARDDVYRHELPHPPGRRGAGIGRRLDGRDVAANDRRHVPGADLFPADQRDLRRLHHRVSGFDHRHEPFRFNHAERLTHSSLLQLANGSWLTQLSAVDHPYPFTASSASRLR